MPGFNPSIFTDLFIQVFQDFLNGTYPGFYNTCHLGMNFIDDDIDYALTLPEFILVFQ